MQNSNARLKQENLALRLAAAGAIQNGQTLATQGIKDLLATPPPSELSMSPPQSSPSLSPMHSDDGSMPPSPSNSFSAQVDNSVRKNIYIYGQEILGLSWVFKKFYNFLNKIYFEC